MTSELDAVFRNEYGRAVSVLTGVLGDITLAEDAVQAAFEVATRRWPVDGTPPSPAGWLITTARRAAIDLLRREAKRPAKESAATALTEQLSADDNEEVSAVPDDRLRMFFTCAHPALSTAAQTALTLRILGGLTTAEIGRAFLTSEQTIAQRIVRAKAKIRDASIPYRVPSAAELPERLGGVLRAIYLIFNEGHLASAGDDPVRDDLATDAIGLARLLSALMPDEPEASGLLALLLLTQARRPARVDDAGELVSLDQQDRSVWDRTLIAEGHALVRACLRRNQPGSYQIQAAIAAVHADSDSFTGTDWPQIIALYDQLTAIDPSPVIAVGRAVAIGESAGAEAGLIALERIQGAAALQRYAVYPAARAQLLHRAGRASDARSAYDAAISRARNPAERRDLEARRAAT
ncbi:sigma-70 family RNA polymerase sigma factor [Epidermidibacterium keratini]|uniref:Sigma-70 family RNA polymerase sigma factor n=1 Tax=Epidermidibacterium keratini TaxID=1891644 RepID=A0A7L4YIP3_9ACTN|nr:sigma-70 family RNA polymerase sigma factor [Epidermidibacterium keratini]QHB99037.1 sigma-70 family RNA polymerase sigma factor [Epidermidibacterium keratini]